MGWKLKLLVVEGYNGPSSHTLMASILGLPSTPIAKRALLEVNWPPKTSIGRIGSGLVIIDDQLVDRLLDGEAGACEHRMLEMFRGHRVLVASLHSVYDFYAFALYENGRMIRLARGDAENGIIFDRGPPTDVERRMAEDFSSILDGERIYRMELPDGSSYKAVEHEMGEEFVFELIKDFTGVRIDEDDVIFEEDLMTEVELDHEAIDWTTPPARIKLELERLSPILNPAEEQLEEGLLQLQLRGPTFAILSREDDSYVQVGGVTPDQTVEARLYEDESYRHYIAGRSFPSGPTSHIPMNNGGVHVYANEVLEHSEVFDIMRRFLRDQELHPDYQWRDVSHVYQPFD